MYQGHYAMDGSSANNTLTSDVWYHLMWTFDKSAGEMKMYLDGSLIQTQTGKLSFLGTSKKINTISNNSNIDDDHENDKFLNKNIHH